MDQSFTYNAAEWHYIGDDLAAEMVHAATQTVHADISTIPAGSQTPLQSVPVMSTAAAFTSWMGGAGMVAAGCSIIGISSGIWWMRRRWASSNSPAGVPPPASHSSPQVETVLSIPPWQVRMLPMPVVHQPSLVSISAPPLSWEILLFPNGPDVPKPSQPILPADLPPKATYRKDADILAASGATQAVRACLIAGVSIGALIASASVLQLWKCRQIAQCLQRASAYPGYELSIAQREVGQSLTVPSCTGINAKPLSEFPGKSVNTTCAPL